jgi:hypothetical protein
MWISKKPIESIKENSQEEDDESEDDSESSSNDSIVEPEVIS